MYRLYYIIYIYTHIATRCLHARRGGRRKKENRKILWVEMRDGGLDDIAKPRSHSIFFRIFPSRFSQPFRRAQE